VHEKFAGKRGTCPKCKHVIEIPKASEEVVIHAPEHSEAGAKDAAGQHVLKPIARKKTTVHPVLVVAICGAVLVVVLAAWLLRGAEDKTPFLALGAVLLAPPLCWAGYTFLRDEELEAHSGMSLAIRTAVCSAIYAALWAAQAYVYPAIFGESQPEVWSMVMVAPVYLFLGASTAYLCYDLDMGNGFFHYCFYLVVTILLRMIMGLHPVYEAPPAPPVAQRFHQSVQQHLVLGEFGDVPRYRSVYKAKSLA
jgi:cation transport ATPase